MAVILGFITAFFLVLLLVPVLFCIGGILWAVVFAAALVAKKIGRKRG